MKRLALLLVLAVGVSAGCSKKPDAVTADLAAAAPAAAQPAASAQSPAPAAAGGAAQAAMPTSFTGTVVETMDAATYTYVRLKTSDGEIWAASGKFPVKVGETLTVPVETPMENFHSPSLNRDFPVIFFASRMLKPGESANAAPMPALAASHGAQPAAGGGAMGGMMGAMMGGQTQRTAPVVEKMPPPEGGLSVADVWATRASLKGKTVTVRGTVVKFNGGILGRNWVHVQDGSGKAADGTNDLTITCDAAVKVGDVITATGIVAIDKDFTAGYLYPVIVEGAKVVVR